jgi:hypothetical protein
MKKLIVGCVALLGLGLGVEAKACVLKRQGLGMGSVAETIQPAIKPAIDPIKVVQFGGGVQIRQTALRGPGASDVTEYQAFAVKNTTDVTVYYEVKWGNGGWKTYTLSPGMTRRHFYRDDPDRPAPQAELRFDAVIGDEALTFRTHGMPTELVDELRKAPVFTFALIGENEINLRLPRAQPEVPLPFPPEVEIR